MSTVDIRLAFLFSFFFSSWWPLRPFYLHSRCQCVVVTFVHPQVVEVELSVSIHAARRCDLELKLSL